MHDTTDSVGERAEQARESPNEQTGLLERRTLRLDFSEPRASEVFASPRHMIATSKSSYQFGLARAQR